jgi:hypothetical protein
MSHFDVKLFQIVDGGAPVIITPPVSKLTIDINEQDSPKDEFNDNNEKDESSLSITADDVRAVAARKRVEQAQAALKRLEEEEGPLSDEAVQEQLKKFLDQPYSVNFVVTNNDEKNREVSGEESADDQSHQEEGEELDVVEASDKDEVEGDVELHVKEEQSSTADDDAHLVVTLEDLRRVIAKKHGEEVPRQEADVEYQEEDAVESQEEDAKHQKDDVEPQETDDHQPLKVDQEVVPEDIERAQEPLEAEQGANLEDQALAQRAGAAVAQLLLSMLTEEDSSVTITLGDTRKTAIVEDKGGHIGAST